MPHLPDTIALHDTAGNYRLLSPKIREILGWGPAELLGRNAYELVHPDDLAVSQRKYHDAVLKGASVRGRVRFRHREGHYVWMEFTSVPVFDAPDKPLEVTGIFSVNRDITPLVEMEQVTQEQARQLTHMQDLARMAWFSMGLRSGRLRHSESFVEITGRAGSTFRHLKGLYLLVHPSDRVWLRMAFSHLRRLPADVRFFRVGFIRKPCLQTISRCY